MKNNKKALLILLIVMFVSYARETIEKRPKLSNLKNSGNYF